MRTIVTAGAKGADIDVLACAIAYAELLSLEGKEATPVICGKFTSSVTESLLRLNLKYETEYTTHGNENFVLVDISAKEHFPNFVDLERVVEVYDHRHGDEQYWLRKLGNNAHIEMVGSCGTLIWREFKKRGQNKSISTNSARLLLASIVSNTLNFKASLTTKEDEQAYQELLEITGCGREWIENYFDEQEKLLLNNFETLIKNDTKTFNYGRGNFVIAQVEMWNADALLKTKKENFDNVMKEFNSSPWIVSILNIEKGHNILYSTDTTAQKIFERIFGVIFSDGVANTKELLMRKQLMKALKENEDTFL